MKLGFSTNAFTRFDLEQAIAKIAEAGFEGVEILADEPHAYPARLTAHDGERIGELLRKHRLAVSNVNANCSFGYWRDAPPEAYFEPSIISPNKKHREDRLELIRKTMEFARRIGAGNISITSGRMLGGMPPAKAEKQFAESMGRVLEMADEFEVNVGIECEPGLYLEYVAELAEWIDRLGHPRLGANLDIGHCEVIGESIPEAIELLAGRIWNMHVEDIWKRKHYHLVPGEGTINWQEVKAALEKIEYARFLTVELYTQTAEPRIAADRSHRFLRGLFEGKAWASMKTVTIFGKPECHLCDEVEKVVRDVASRRQFRVDKRNILDDPILVEKYKTAIPVIQVDGKEIARHRITAAALEAALAR